jgi:hypothetical protein
MAALFFNIFNRREAFAGDFISQRVGDFPDAGLGDSDPFACHTVLILLYFGGDVI